LGEIWADLIRFGQKRGRDKALHFLFVTSVYFSKYRNKTDLKR